MFRRDVTLFSRLILINEQCENFWEVADFKDLVTNGEVLFGAFLRGFRLKLSYFNVLVKAVFNAYALNYAKLRRRVEKLFAILKYLLL